MDRTKLHELAEGVSGKVSREEQERGSKLHLLFTCENLEMAVPFWIQGRVTDSEFQCWLLVQILASLSEKKSRILSPAGLNVSGYPKSGLPG